MATVFLPSSPSASWINWADVVSRSERHRLTVALAERAYDIHIGAGLLGDGELLRAAIPGPLAMVVSDERVAPLYLEPLRAVLSSLPGLRCAALVLPDGEQHKNLTGLARIYDALIEAGADRDVSLLALGGGVVGDMCGFAAATYLRGVDYLQLPTTLLAQVDASVGGKTAVDHLAGKNMIGAFHQPRCVIADVDTLSSLPLRDYRAGLAEVIKYGLLGDAVFFGWLEGHSEALLQREAGAQLEAIRRSCAHKADIVVADERETGGRRALLNLGHSFAHAIETVESYRGLRHGEAVSVGMALAARLSVRCGMLDSAAAERIEALLSTLDLPVRPPPGLATDALIAAMWQDKKRRAGRLRLVLLDAIGSSRLLEFDDEPALRAVWEGCS